MQQTKCHILSKEMVLTKTGLPSATPNVCVVNVYNINTSTGIDANVYVLWWYCVNVYNINTSTGIDEMVLVR